MRPTILVLSYAQISSNEIHQLMPFYHLDTDGNALAVGRELINQRQLIINREYERWLRQKIEEKDPHIQVALDNIYNQATTSGVIIATLAQCVPFYTHAHILRDIILELAKQEPL